MFKWDSFPGSQRYFKIHKSVNVIQPPARMKYESRMIISIDVGIIPVMKNLE